MARHFLVTLHMTWVQQIIEHVDQDTTEVRGTRRVVSEIHVVAPSEATATDWAMEYYEFIGDPSAAKIFVVHSCQPIHGIVLNQSVQPGPIEILEEIK